MFEKSFKARALTRRKNESSVRRYLTYHRISYLEEKTTTSNRSFFQEFHAKKIEILRYLIREEWLPICVCKLAQVNFLSLSIMRNRRFEIQF